MNNDKLSDNKLFRLICICLFSLVIYLGLKDIGGLFALIPLLVCLSSGIIAGLICYSEYNNWKNS